MTNEGWRFDYFGDILFFHEQDTGICIFGSLEDGRRRGEDEGQGMEHKVQDVKVKWDKSMDIRRVEEQVL